MLRTFSKIYGLAGLRVGYAVGPWDVCAAMAKLRRPFDVTTTAQAAALASLADPDEVARRRALNASGLVALGAILRAPRLRLPPPSPVGNFVYVDLGEDAAPLFERLLERGRDRPPASRLRRADRDPRLGRHARGASRSSPTPWTGRCRHERVIACAGGSA